MWLFELTHFLDVMVHAGFGYDIASPNGGDVRLDENSVKDGIDKDPINGRFMRDAGFLAKLES